MKKLLSVLCVGAMMLAMLAGCGNSPAKSGETGNGSAPAEQKEAAQKDGEKKEGKKVYNVAYLVNGNLGDKSFFDSAEAGLETLKKAGRITLKTIEMGGTDADKPKWLSTLYEVAESNEYDVIVCGTYQMPDFLKEVAEKYPEQKFITFDDDTYAGNCKNVVNLTYKQNELGYIIGVFAACMTKDTKVKNINPEKVIGFVGGIDSPVINDFLYGYIIGAQKVDKDIKIDTRYTNDYVDTAKAKEYGLSMISDNKADIIWGVAGNAGNGAAAAALEKGNAWFIGVDSDQEATFPADLAAITLTSGLKNIGNSLVYIFDELDKGKTYWGQLVSFGLDKDGVGIVTDKNFAKYASEETKKAVKEAIDDVIKGKVKVPTVLGGANEDELKKLRNSVQP